MAAKIVSGGKGAVTFPVGAGEAGQTVQITDWTATIERDEHVVDNFDDSDNWERVQFGRARLRGTANGFFDADTADTDKIAAFSVEDDAADAAITLTAYTAKAFAFAGGLNNVVTTAAKSGGPVTISFNFRSSGPVTET